MKYSYLQEHEIFTNCQRILKLPKGQDGFNFGIFPNNLLVRFILQRVNIWILPGQISLKDQIISLWGAMISNVIFYYVKLNGKSHFNIQ